MGTGEHRGFMMDQPLKFLNHVDNKSHDVDFTIRGAEEHNMYDMLVSGMCTHQH